MSAMYSDELKEMTLMYIDNGRNVVEKLKQELERTSADIRYSLIQNAKLVDWSVLHESASKNDLEIMKRLLHEFSPEQKWYVLTMNAKIGSTPLRLAAYEGSTDTAKYLLESAPAQRRYEYLQMTDESGYAALHRAATHNHLQTIQVLLSFLSPQQQFSLLKERNNRNQTVVDILSTAYPQGLPSVMKGTTLADVVGVKPEAERQPEKQTGAGLTDEINGKSEEGDGENVVEQMKPESAEGDMQDLDKEQNLPFEVTREPQAEEEAKENNTEGLNKNISTPLKASIAMKTQDNTAVKQDITPTSPAAAEQEKGNLTEGPDKNITTPQIATATAEKPANEKMDQTFPSIVSVRNEGYRSNAIVKSIEEKLQRFKRQSHNFNTTCRQEKEKRQEYNSQIENEKLSLSNNNTAQGDLRSKEADYKNVCGELRKFIRELNAITIPECQAQVSALESSSNQHDLEEVNRKLKLAQKKKRDKEVELLRCQVELAECEQRIEDLEVEKQKTSKKLEELERKLERCEQKIAVLEKKEELANKKIEQCQDKITNAKEKEGQATSGKLFPPEEDEDDNRFSQIRQVEEDIFDMDDDIDQDFGGGFENATKPEAAKNDPPFLNIEQNMPLRGFSGTAAEVVSISEVKKDVDQDSTKSFEGNTKAEKARDDPLVLNKEQNIPLRLLSYAEDVSIKQTDDGQHRYQAKEVTTSFSYKATRNQDEFNQRELENNQLSVDRIERAPQEINIETAEDEFVGDETPLLIPAEDDAGFCQKTSACSICCCRCQ